MRRRLPPVASYRLPVTRSRAAELDARHTVDYFSLSMNRNSDADWQLATGNWETGYYSYLSASIGSSRDALNAGYRPKKIPTLAEKPIPIANDHQGSEMGKPDSR